MGIEYKQTYIHWNYFLAIESDLEKTSRYVEFSAANNDTFSIEFARIIKAATQEIYGIMKKICQLLAPDITSSNVNHYRNIIKTSLPNFITEEVQILRFGMNSKPWINWKNDETTINPDWWKANNDIKHNRTQHFEKANLKNAYNAVGALLITTLYYYKLKFQTANKNETTPNMKEVTSALQPLSSLIILKNENYENLGTWQALEW